MAAWFKDFLIYPACETIAGQRGWMNKVLLLDVLLINDGHVNVTNNPDVVKLI